MTRTLAVYLWKEWRDNFAILIGLFVAVPLLLAICKYAIPEEITHNHIFPPVTALSCYLIALLSLASDSIPGERRRGRLDFLRRMPADLTAPFVAKVVFLALALSGFALYGWSLACEFGEVPRETKPVLAYTSVWFYCLAPWVFAVSCWLPRGALAVPAAGLGLILLGLPFYLILSGEHTPRVSPDEVTTLAYAIGIWSLPVAWFSWVRGRRQGRSVGAAAWRGVLASLVLFVPAWGYTGYRVYEWRQIDPQSEHFAINGAVLSQDGRRVYLNAFMMRDLTGPTHVLSVDLETGAWERFGDLGDKAILPLPMTSIGRVSSGLRRGPVVAVIDKDASEHYPKQNWLRRAWLHYYDADTGQHIKSGWQDMKLPAVVKRLGARWIDLPAGTVATSRNGAGWHVRSDKFAGLYDPFRKRVYNHGLMREYHSFRVRPGRWLASARKAGGGVYLVDPDTGKGTRARGIADWKRVGRVGILPDGRVLYIRGSRLLVVDPETGEKRVLRNDTLSVHVSGVTPRGHAILWLWVGDRKNLVARLDPETLELSYPDAVKPTSYFTVRPVAVFDNGDMLVIHEFRKLVRVRFGSDYAEVLFPRR